MVGSRLFSLLVLAAALPLAAQSEEFTWVAANAGHTYFGDSAFKSPQFHYGLSGGWWFAPTWGVEVRGTRGNVYTSGETYLNHQSIATASALWRFWPGEFSWQPHVAFGLGAARNVAYGTNNVAILKDLKARPELHIGAGVQHRFGDRWLFQADYRLAHSGLNGTQFNDHLLTVGLGMTFGGAKAAPAPAPAPAPKPPLPPPPTPVETAPVRETPPPVAVVAPTPAPRRKFQAKGAVVRFANGQAVLDDRGETALAQVARSLSGAEGRYRVKVTGHASKIGPRAFNQKLSLQRAQAAADHLVAQGVPAAAIDIEARGSSEPQADNRTRKGRNLNRRSVVTVKGDADVVEVEVVDTAPVTRKVVKKAPAKPTGKAARPHKPKAKAGRHGKGKK